MQRLLLLLQIFVFSLRKMMVSAAKWSHWPTNQSLEVCCMLRPDIAQAVGVVAKFSLSPSQAHLTTAKKILRYLKGTLNLAIKYQKSQNKVTQMQIGQVT